MVTALNFVVLLYNEIEILILMLKYFLLLSLMWECRNKEVHLAMYFYQKWDFELFPPEIVPPPPKKKQATPLSDCINRHI